MGLQSLERQLCPWQMVPCLLPPQLFPALSAPTITAAALHSVCVCVLKLLVHMESMCAFVPRLKREGFCLVKGVAKDSIILLLITPELCGSVPRNTNRFLRKQTAWTLTGGAEKKGKGKRNLQYGCFSGPLNKGFFSSHGIPKIIPQFYFIFVTSNFLRKMVMLTVK